VRNVGPYELREGKVSRPTGQLHSRWVRVEGLPIHARVAAVDPCARACR
jgi:hypothetical protein